jgi:hypothetical protein
MSQVHVGDALIVGGQVVLVAGVADDTHLQTSMAFNPPLNSSVFSFQLPIHRAEDSAGTSQLVVNSQGDVGIGAGAPKAKLDVNGDTTLGGDVWVNMPPLSANDWRTTLKSNVSANTVSTGGSITIMNNVVHVVGRTPASEADFSYYYLLLWREPVGVNGNAAPFITFSGTVGSSRSNVLGVGGLSAFWGGRGWNASSTLAVNGLAGNTVVFVHNVPYNGKQYAALMHDFHTGPGILSWWYDVFLHVGSGDPNGYLDATFKAVTSPVVLHTP